MAERLRIVYEDNDLLVCHKSAKMATEGASAGRMDLISAARNYLARKVNTDTKGRQRNLPPYVATVHRLDQPVEGVIVLAKTKKAASDLTAQIREHRTKKYYYALCLGTFDSKKALLTDHIARREDNKKAIILSDKEAESVDGDAVTLESGEKIHLIGGDVKEAKLEYEVIAGDEGKTLLRIKLLTGRFHQIRAQLAAKGHPILGDNSYGMAESMAYAQEFGIRDVCLVSYLFGLKHPSTGKWTEFSIEPDNMAIKNLLEGTKPSSEMT